MKFRRLARKTTDMLGLTGLYFRLIEWRMASQHERPPAATSDGVPLPPRYLMAVVAGTSHWGWFVESGLAAAKAFDRFAAEGGCSFAQARRILDFGCGSGRVIRNLPALTAADLYGSDYNGALVGWCRRNLKGSYARNRLRPPLRYPDRHFDIVYLMSVFTHLRPETQEQWLLELHRVTRPGGVVLITFHDEDHFGLPDSDVARHALRTTGHYIRNDQSEGSNLMAVFQTRKMASTLFARHFEVVRIVPRAETDMAQTLAILRRTG